MLIGLSQRSHCSCKHLLKPHSNTSVAWQQTAHHRAAATCSQICCCSLSTPARATAISCATVSAESKRRRSCRTNSRRGSREEQQQHQSSSAASGTGDAGISAVGSSNIDTDPHEAAQHRKGRPPRQQTAVAATASDATAAAIVTKRPRGRRKHAPLCSAGAVSQQLISTTGIIPAAAAKLAAAQVQDKSMPQDFSKLEGRVRHVLAVFGELHGAKALLKYPKIVATRPEVLSQHLLSWTSFFEDLPGDAAENQARLLERLSSQPQLLTVNVENLVGNLYEVGAIVQAEDLQLFADKAMKLALMRPEVVQEKMRRVLLLLNSERRMPALDASGAAGHLPTHSPPGPPEFAFADIQKAARRDYRWLLLSSETLEARLRGLQQACQMPLRVVGRMFILQPSLLNKTTEYVADKFTALESLLQLPGQHSTAGDAVAAFPALLNLRTELLELRWQKLQQAAASSPVWQHELENTPAGSLPPLLTVRSSRYDRLQAVAACGQQASRRMNTLLHMSDSTYEAFAAKHIRQQEQ